MHLHGKARTVACYQDAQHIFSHTRTSLAEPGRNYPIGLTLTPLIGAISAGNCAVIKPSENTVASCTALAELVPQVWGH